MEHIFENVVVKSDYHYYWNPKNKIDEERILLSDENNVTNPRYLCLFLSNTKEKSFFSTSPKTHWVFDNGFKMKKYYDKYVLYDKMLNLYLTCDINYNISFTPEITDAIVIGYLDGYVYHIKPELKLNMEINRLKLKTPEWVLNDNQSCCAIILAAGKGSRLGQMKHLVKINHKTSIENICDAFCMDRIIVSSSSTKEELEKYGTVIVNDVDDRLESIRVGINKAQELGFGYVIIHDVARPNITSEHVNKLLESKSLMAQWCIAITNGLHKLRSLTFEIVDRDQHIELCTPVKIKTELAKYIADTYMNKENRIVWEWINILDVMKIKYDLIYGNHKYLKKLTTQDDICD
uniref:MobA-like NTP transferase domain-containing protein n=1 Tax=viral metagenome TaxID=1070528 RepID=A0A6C0ED94_9ZZZZ